MNKWTTAIMVSFLLIGLVGITACTEEGDEEDNGSPIDIITVNDKVVSTDGLTMKNAILDGKNYTGYALKDLFESVSESVREDKMYKVLASDGYMITVAWHDIENGILIEDDNGTTVFPRLTKSFMVRDVVKIQEQTFDGFQLNNMKYTFDQPFILFKWDMVTLNHTDGNSSEGVLLQDIVDHAGVKTASKWNYTIEAGDGYNKTVTWDDLAKGILVKSDQSVFFSELSKSYRIKDVVSINYAAKV